jgi:transcriptional regulator with XRE-family HTH domain
LNPTTDIPTLADRVRERLETLGLSYKDVEDGLGKRNMISDLIYGKKKSVRDDMLSKLAQVLKTTTRYLAGTTDNPALPKPPEAQPVPPPSLKRAPSRPLSPAEIDKADAIDRQYREARDEADWYKISGGFWLRNQLSSFIPETKQATPVRAPMPIFALQAEGDEEVITPDIPAGSVPRLPTLIGCQGAYCLTGASTPFASPQDLIIVKPGEKLRPQEWCVVWTSVDTTGDDSRKISIRIARFLSATIGGITIEVSNSPAEMRIAGGNVNRISGVLFR